MIKHMAAQGDNSDNKGEKIYIYCKTQSKSGSWTVNNLEQ